MTDSSMRLNLSIIRPPLKLIQFFPNNTLQRVVLNGQNSSWTPVFAGILQGSVFWPLRVQGSDLCFYWSPSMTLLKAFHKLYMEPSTDIIHHCFLLSRTLNEYAVLFFFLIWIHSMQGWTATTRHGVTRKEAQKRSNMDLQKISL